MTDKMPDVIWAYIDNESIIENMWSEKPFSFDTIEKYYRADTFPQWQPIETAPKGNHEIFYVSSKKYYPPYVVVNAAKDCPLKDEYPWRAHQSGNMIHKSIITHWMPLPKPPVE